MSRRLTNQQSAWWRGCFVGVYLFQSGFLTLFVCLAASGNDAVPPSPNKPWYPRTFNEYEAELAHGALQHGQEGIEIDPNKVYDLPELIDIAQRSNPQTRVAWERARQAAAAVGLSKSDYFPYLAASAGARYEHLFIEFPTLQQGPGPAAVSILAGGTLTLDAAAERAALGVKWLLFDFGERKAAVTAAKERLVMADVGFNATHQQIVFTVTQRFYEFNTARQKVEVAESSLQAAETIGRSARARLDHGLTTKPETLQSDEQTAQASFDLEAARGALSDAQVALVESLGILPTTRLQVAEVSGKPIPENFGNSLDEMLDRALSQRPDLVAKLANVRARRAEVKKTRAAYHPKITLDASAGWAQLDVSAQGSPFFGGNQPVYGGGLAIELPIFDGFARGNKRRLAESELRAAEDELAGSRDAVIREVWQAYTDFGTALRKQESAAKLLAAAENAYAASLAAYRQGLGTYVDVANAQRSLAAARSVVVDTRSAIYTAAAALALSIGDLARPAPPSSPHHPQ
ncbi:MAG: transporter [Pedosphaera sp.]|nr:transporter [Pedosphaera sp.]